MRVTPAPTLTVPARGLRALALAVLTWLCAAGSHAEPPKEVLFAPTYVESGAADGLGGPVREAITSLLAEAGVQVRHVRDWPQACACGPASMSFDCYSDPCIDALREEAADILLLSLFAPRVSGDGSVGLAWSEPPDHWYSTTLRIEGPPERVIADLRPLVQQLLAARTRGPGPWLVVAGEPRGAGVKVDGEVVGILPFEGRVARPSPDNGHTVEVYHDGYEPFVSTVFLTPEAQAEARLQVHLEPGHNPAADSPDSRRKLRGWLMVSGGSVATAVGLAYMATALRAHRAQNCASVDAGSACERYVFGDQSRRKLIAGTVVTTAGLVTAALGTWQLSLLGSREHAGFSVGRSF